MKTTSLQTPSIKAGDITRDWYIIDAEDQIVGRMCTHIATKLRGKDKPSYSPNMDCGDFVVVINADKIRFTGNKMDQKEYVTYSGYPGGQKRKTPRQIMERKPELIIEKAVRGMIPKTKLGRAVIKKLFVYAGSDHPHGAQKPKEIKF